MRLPGLVMIVFIVVTVTPAAAVAQAGLMYRARITFESAGVRIDSAGQFSGPQSNAWVSRSLVLAAADSSWEAGRFKIAGGLVAAAETTAGATIIAREAYARAAITSWMDVEGGKRLLRWGVGYGFSPTGVIDPPRRATDPTDRLGRQEGMPLFRVNVVRGDTEITFASAWPTLARSDAPAGSPSRLMAARVRTVLRGGLEIALVAAAAPDRRPAFGANATHVIGQRLEWHAEVLVHDGVTGVAGVQCTLPAVNVIVEYHRRHVDSPGGGSVGHFLFVRATRAGADLRLAPELIVIREIDDGGWTAIAGLAWTPRSRVEFYARATRTAGGNAQVPAPRASRTITAGATVRF